MAVAERPAVAPYAIEVIDDIIWYNESNQRPDVLVRFDPKTEKFQSWAIPSGVGIIRHMRETPDGNLTIHQTQQQPHRPGDHQQADRLQPLGTHNGT